MLTAMINEEEQAPGASGFPSGLIALIVPLLQARLLVRGIKLGPKQTLPSNYGPPRLHIYQHLLKLSAFLSVITIHAIE